MENKLTDNSRHYNGSALLHTPEAFDRLQGAELLQAFLAACNAPEQVQQRVLMEIIGRNANTEFGRAHGFDQIHTIEDFRQRVAISEWADVEPDANRMETGAKDLLFPGQPIHFITTSGTTGAFKRIPESATGDRVKSLVSRSRITILAKMVPELMEGFFIPLSRGATTGKTVAGIPFGFASGMTLATTPVEVLRRMAFPPALFQVNDAASLDYLIMRFSVAKPDIHLLVGNNPGRMMALLELANQRRDTLIDDIERGALADGLVIDAELRNKVSATLTPDPGRAAMLREMVARRGRLEPRDYWPRLRMIVCWLGGSVGRYLDGLRPWLPADIPFCDFGYGSSEGKFNIPMQPGSAAAPLAIFGYFFEFLPTTGGPPLLAHQLETGNEYQLIITSYSGLYRYNMHDIVSVEGFTAETPNIRFVSKTRDVANVSGEKVNGAFMAEVIRACLAQAHQPWRHFCVYANNDAHRYEFCIEPVDNIRPNSNVLRTLDEALVREHAGYRLLRNQGLIRPSLLHVMAPGWQEQLYALRTRDGAAVNQVKLPLICDTPPDAQFVHATLEP